MELLVAVVLPFLIMAVCAWIRFKPTLNVSPLPVGALAVVITGSVLGHDFFHAALGPIPLTIDRLLLGGILFLFVWRWFHGQEDLRKLNRLDLALLVWMAAISLSTLMHNWSIMDNLPVSRLLFFNLLPLTVYWVVRTSRLTVADLKFISAMMAVFGLYLALTAIAEVKDYTSLVFPGYISSSDFQEFLGRGRGPFLNPVSNGIFMTLCCSCAMMWWPRTGPVGKLTMVVAGLIFCVGIYATLTRSVWLGFVIASGLFAWIPASRPAKGAMIMVATAITIVAFPILSEKIFSFKRDKNVSQAAMEQSAQMRPMFAWVALKMFEDRPLTGVGFGQYAKAKYPYLQDPHSGMPLSVTRGFMQHNVFLAYLTETGLIGLSCLVVALTLVARVSWKVWSHPKLDIWARQFGLLAIVMLVVYSVNGMFHDTSIIPMQHMLMFFVFGLANNIHTTASEFETCNSPTGWTPAPLRSSQFAPVGSASAG